MLLNAAKCQGYSFYCFWVIKGNTTGERGEGKIAQSPPHQIRVNKWLIIFSGGTSLMQSELVLNSKIYVLDVLLKIIL